MDKENTYNDIDILIVNFLSRKIDAADMEKLRQWVNQSAENKKYFNQKQAIWMATLPSDSKHFDSENAYLRFLNYTDNQTDPNRKRRSKKAPSLKAFWYSAAVILLLIGVATISYRQGTEQLKTQFPAILV